MSCNINKKNCGCDFNIKTFGICDVSRITLDGSDRTVLNWSEISIPEIVKIPQHKPVIEHLDQVYVEAIINCAKLIETPFAYKNYERAASTLEITAATTAINLANINITRIITAVNAILSIPGLPAIPAVAALTVALNAVTAASTSLTTTIQTALKTLDNHCISAAAVIVLINTVLSALKILQQTLNALLIAANQLVTATTGIPIVGLAVSAAVNLLLTTINAVFSLITTALTALNNVIVLIGDTNILVVIPNEEGSCLSGRKLVIEGQLKQKIVYTALVSSQSVHSVCNTIPFSAYIIPYANFVGLTYVENIAAITKPALPCETTLVNGFLFNPSEPIEVVLCEEFNVSSCIEDIFAYAIADREVFKNVTLFLSAKPTGC